MVVRVRGHVERRPAPAPAPAPSHARVSFRHLPRISWARRDRCFRRRPTRRAPRPGAPDPPLATNPQESERELIAVTEFNENFKGKLIQVLWPDTGKWYNAEVIKVNVKNRTAKLFYVDSEEKEDINLYEAMLNMEVSWPFKGGVVGKTPASSEKKRKTRDESPPPSEVSSDDDAPRNPRPKKKTTANAPKKAAPAKRPPGAGAGPSDEARRVFAEKVKDAMLVATNELGGKAGEKNSEFDPASAADGVERAAFALFGKDVKKYNDKARSLLFNLKDPKNPSLRARVLTGELQPEALARMTPADLARRDLQEMRREREARLGEDAFLTAGPATRLVKTSKGEELVVVGGGEVVEEGDGLGNRKEETLAQQVAAAASAAAAAAAVPAAAPVEEADTPRAPSAEAPPVSAPAELTTFEAFAAGVASSDEDEDAPAENAGGDAQDDDDEYDPAKGFEAGGSAAAADEPSPRREKEAAAKKTAPSAPAPPKSPSAGTWTGTLHLSGLGKSRWRAFAADGERASFPEVLPKTLEIQGRVQFEETNVFLGEVFQGRSKTRGVTIGVGVPENEDDAFAKDLTAMYRKKERYGLIKGGKRLGDWELYLVPQGELASRLLEVFKPEELNQASLAEKGKSAMLWCVVHAKHLGPNARATRAQPSARSLNETRGFRESDEDDAGGTPPRTIPQAYQSTKLEDPYARANRAEPAAFAPYPQGAPPAPQYGAPPHVAFVTSVPPPPRRADHAEDFLNATFGAPPPAAVRTVPPPPFARVADVPPPPFAAGTGGPPGAPPVFDPRRPDDREWGERRAREFRAGPSGFDRRDDRRDDWRDARRDDWRDDRRDGPRFREDDRYRRDDRPRSPPRESRGEPPCMICRDRGYTNVMHTHATEQHARRSDRDAFSPRGGRGGRGGPFGGGGRRADADARK